MCLLSHRPDSRTRSRSQCWPSHSVWMADRSAPATKTFEWAKASESEGKFVAGMVRDYLSGSNDNQE